MKTPNPPEPLSTNHNANIADQHALWQQNQQLAQEVIALRKEMEQVRAALKKTQSQPKTFPWNLLIHPLVVLSLSLAAALAFAALVILDQELSKSGGRHSFFLFYMVPISAPFLAFSLDRIVRLQQPNWWQWAVDLPVVVISFARAFYEIPLISGHALFLTYALLTIRSRMAKVITVLILGQVIYLKFYVWQDSTLYGGILVGAAAAGLFRLVSHANFLSKRLQG